MRRIVFSILFSSLLPVVVASTFGFQIDGIETIKHGALGVPPAELA
jgi:hypothetical protein